MKIVKVFILLIVLLFASCMSMTTDKHMVKAFSNQVIQHGATGDDVIELQARLQYLGFYNGNIDGVFGWGTYWALRNFQHEFGLEVDGLAGEKAKQKLEKASEYDKAYIKNQIRQGNDFTYYGGIDKQKQTTDDRGSNDQNPNQQTDNNQTTQEQQQNATTNEDLQPSAVNVPQGFSQNDIQIMANAVHGEARGEPYEGKVAVAAVILNRVESSTFPNTVSGVIFEPRAFTAVSDGQIWLEPDDSAERAVLDAINGWDPSGEAIYYYNPNTATSDWIFSRKTIKKIGKHIFAI
ncbi:spore cortex-lytic enzyme prepeptide [Gracilibacillus halophilus YIM-C55.5]|uniref:Spore cortex-lytic enzyme n=1 Tax=Gracilibacillus halophilus YIM-C55.5 TaxID=1308866 RepID=N4WAN0_9BACI|nr:spore cortex-lytic enzyme [Gracilibacillus halophilus]ENH97358.1 spore cortex-lytic enzyme prepeptide [Gracilibacillus halophilus YIM-C55.5]